MNTRARWITSIAAVLALAVGVVLVVSRERPAIVPPVALPTTDAPSISDTTSDPVLETPPVAPTRTQESRDPVHEALASTRITIAPPSTVGAAGPTAELRVSVRSASGGSPIAFAEVRLAAANSELLRTSGSATLDFLNVTIDRPQWCGADGALRIDVPPGVPLRLSGSLEREGYAARELDVPALAQGETRDVVLDLQPDSSPLCWFQLIDATSRTPLRTHYMLSTTGVSASMDAGTTDSQGRFYLPVTSSEVSMCSLSVTGRGRRIVVPDATHPTSANPIVVPVEKAARLTVTAQTADGQVAEGVTFRLKTRARAIAHPPVDPFRLKFPQVLETWECRTSSSGHAAIDDLSPGTPYTVECVERPDWELPPLVAFTAGERRAVTWKVDGACTLHGRVLDQENRPVERRELWLARADARTPTTWATPITSRRSMRTDERGEFHFEQVPAGIWWIGPSPLQGSRDAPELEVAGFGDVVEIGADATSVDVTVRADRGLSVTGTVLDPSGAPIADVRVQAIATFAGDRITGASKSDGSFRLGPMLKTTYEVWAVGRAGLGESEHVRVAAPTPGVVLSLRHGCRLSGRLAPMPSRNGTGRVALYPATPDADWILDTKVDKEGAFEFAGVAPGEYFVVASHSSGLVGASGTIVVRESEAERSIDVGLVEGGTVRLFSEDPRLRATLEIRQGNAIWTRTTIRGEFPSRLSCPAGDVSLRITCTSPDARTIERSVSVQAGATAEILLPVDAR